MCILIVLLFLLGAGPVVDLSLQDHQSAVQHLVKSLRRDHEFSVFRVRGGGGGAMKQLYVCIVAFMETQPNSSVMEVQRVAWTSCFVFLGVEARVNMTEKPF